MSWYNGVPATLLSAGPPSNFAAAAAASTAAQSICVGASGNFYLPTVPVGFWEQGVQGPLLIAHLTGVVTSSTTSTTFVLTVGLNATDTTAGGASAPTTTVLYTNTAVTMTSTTAGLGWELDLKILNRGTGYGTTTTSTSLLTSGIVSWNTAQQCGNATAQPITTIDASVPQYMWATVTFSTSSTSNSMTLQQFLLYGMK